MQFLVRSGLVFLFVLVSHSLEWPSLAYATSEAILALSTSLGVPGMRLSVDTIQLAAENYQFLVSCTFIDVIMGSIALMWNQHAAIATNCIRLTFWAAALLIFNVFRLELAVLGHLRGIPWYPIDGIVGGLAYFLVWLAIWHWKSWSIPDTPMLWARFARGRR